MNQKIIIWLLRVIAAVIMLQTLYFKFSAAPESVFIFSSLGLEPYGRIGIGVLELIASVLILIPVSSAFGALLAMGLMTGAIFSHATKLGIIVMDDGGQLFVYALIVFICSIILFIKQRKDVYQVMNLNEKFWV
jgi:uncharacterized membrane protein YphA (DoxX/SURF4 family)